MSKTPNGFRAVRYCDSIHIYYIEQTEDGRLNATNDFAFGNQPTTGYSNDRQGQ